MNSEHLRTFIWLRWRLFIRQLQRGGKANQVILVILAVGIVLGVLFFSVTSFVAGLFAGEVPADKLPAVVMYAWDLAVILFIISWGSGLIAELQRAEALSLEKFLHLPVSLGGVFVLNYVSSLPCLTMAMFLPVVLGFSVAFCFSIGPAMLMVLPLLASFLLMVTALSYQFQGWLASLMVNKRRRRSIIVGATFLFVLLCQLPNVINIVRPWGGRHKPDLPPPPQNIDVEDWIAKGGQLADKKDEQAQERDDRTFAEVTRMVRFVSVFLPPGWLPIGAMAAAEGSVWPALLGTLGMGLIGTASLWRAYRTTIRLYTGQFTGTPSAERAVRGADVPTVGKEQARQPVARSTGNLLERRLPWVSEQAAVIALGGFRSLLRAPEVRMLLLTPVFFLLIFGATLFRPDFKIPDVFRPFLGFAAFGLALFSLTGIVGNQFGFDRSGFRVFVLSPAPRREILLGKNLSVMPLALALALLPLIIVQFIQPAGFEHLLAEPARFITMYLLFCMLANWLSLLAPMPIAAGSLKPTNVKVIPVLLQFACIFLLPIFLAPALLPLGIEYLLQDEGWTRGVPVYALSSVILCAVIVVVYRLVLSWQGGVLQSFELDILRTITTKAE